MLLAVSHFICTSSDTATFAYQAVHTQRLMLTHTKYANHCAHIPYQPATKAAFACLIFHNTFCFSCAKLALWKTCTRHCTCGQGYTNPQSHAHDLLVYKFRVHSINPKLCGWIYKNCAHDHRLTQTCFSLCSDEQLGASH